MIKTPALLAAAACGALALAGCTSSEAATADPSPASSSGAALATGATGQGGAPTDMAGRGGLTGEIAYVSDGVAQVQDGSTQTAVRFTDSTEVTQQVTIAVGDVAVGSCVVAMLGDDGAATTVTVTEPAEDGTCEVGFGGVRGGMGGEMPDGGQRPEGMEVPDDIPTAMPSIAPDGGDVPVGDMGGGFDLGSLVTGTVTAASDTALTVVDADGESTEVPVGASTAVTGTQEADDTAIAVGMCVTATGEADSSGGYDATALMVFAPTDGECASASGFGGRGGMPTGGPRGETDQAGDAA